MTFRGLEPPALRGSGPAVPVFVPGRWLPPDVVDRSAPVHWLTICGILSGINERALDCRILRERRRGLPGTGLSRRARQEAPGKGVGDDPAPGGAGADLALPVLEPGPWQDSGAPGALR